MKNYIYGKNTLASALEHNDSINEIFLVNNFSDGRINKLIKEKNIKVSYKTNEEITKILGPVNHQGVMAEVEEYHYLTLEELIKKCEKKLNPLIVMLDGLEDPHNLGAILRSADAFGVDGIIIGANRSVKLNGTVAKVSTGAIEYVDVCMVTNLNQAVAKLKDNGYWVVASDGNATLDYREVDYKMKSVIIVGSEGFGISHLLLKNSDFIVKIPMVGHVNSLNASVAAALFIAQAYNSKNPLK